MSDAIDIKEAPEGARRGKHKSRGAKILAGCAIGIVAVVALAVGGFFAYIRLTYADFYSKAKEEFQIPALSSGFIPQDIAYAESDNSWFFSGYESDGDESPIWRINPDGSTTHIKVLEPNGNVYHGHGGGFTIAGDFAYLTCTNGFYILNSSDIMQQGDSLEITAVDMIDVGFDPAFINAQDDTLYTGVFYYEGPYDSPEKMHLTSPDGTQNHAVMYAYALDASERYGLRETPFAVFSIPDKVQGVAVTDAHQFVFSTSWGLGASVLPIYSLENLTPEGTYEVDGQDIDLFFMDGRNFVSQIDAPPMMEGIIFHDGSIWMSNESASNKYFFGKIYGGGAVFSIAP